MLVCWFVFFCGLLSVVYVRCLCVGGLMFVFVVRCSWLLLAVCCVLFAVCCLVCIIRCSLCVVCCLFVWSLLLDCGLFVVCCLLSVVVCCLLFAVV